jgi:Zn-dependent peptidase ImmA (M78 family)/O-acetyl-ADP-ribose deacetylase (regulator of RNase III)
MQWTNRSVLQFAGQNEPVLEMEHRARRAVLNAMDAGWSGPPFDPIRLANLLGIETVARQDVADARTVPVEGGRLRIEFNPMRPRGRLRFSIAHEIAHTFLPDCSEAVRHRGGTHVEGPDSWQLEVICNIGAAELLMPMGSFATELKDAPLRIQTVLELQKRFDVSIEALMLRMLKLSNIPAAVFCASYSEAVKRYRLDYVVPSRTWTPPVRAGLHLPERTAVADANAIGFTAAGSESWIDNEPYAVECVGLAPHPGGVVPRVVGFLLPAKTRLQETNALVEVIGDALEPRGKGPRIVAHIVPDIVHPWGGRGFAAALRKRYRSAWQEFHERVGYVSGLLELGSTVRGRLGKDIHVLHMVAQRGFGSSPFPRIRYSALERCLRGLHDWAVELDASVHLPRVGTGEAGGRWVLIRELIDAELAARGVTVTVYQLPEKRTHPAHHPAADYLESAVK